MVIKCGTRGSLLAVMQTQLVIDALKEKHPGLKIELQEISTRGDAIQDDPLGGITNKKDWIYELEIAILSGDIDFAVHSSKDIPRLIEAGTALLPVLPRGNPGDAFIGRIISEKGERVKFLDLPKGAKVGTSSLRRRAYLLKLRPDLNVVESRGNVPERLQQMDENLQDDLSGILLAAAGLERLKLKNLHYEIISKDQMLPGLSQATLAVQFRENDEQMKKMLNSLVHPPTFATWQAERRVIKTLQPHCRSVMAAYAECVGDELILKSDVMLADGSKSVSAEGRANLNQAEMLGESVAKQLLEKGAQQLIDACR
ncbi:MAG: hydroxymethylbilane synthase [Gammaproteobacteria bacterium]|nr:hydroxymethylbilane synthase [Gammaproteobacteria bacterium]